MNAEKFGNLIFKQSNDTAILTFNGDLTTEDCDRLRSALMSSIENSELIVVNFERAINIDLICLQILCMARRISRRLKKFMILTGKSAVVIKQGLESNNYSCFLDFAFVNNKSCVLL
jgi:anti-anti-sigma regulatory factor